jgi:5-methylcytosine-specific restriction enzyme A
MDYTPGQPYTRADIFQLLKLDPVPSGGPWFTGHHIHEGEAYVFVGVGIAGRTGHQYANYWVGEDLHWTGRARSRRDQPVITKMTDGSHIVHIFTREDDKAPYTYQGNALASSVSSGPPVTLIWAFADRELTTPEEVVESQRYPEGATKPIAVNAYERSPKARQDCIDHYGAKCVVCGFDFAETYGDIGAGYIHVHHVVPLSTVEEDYEVDPIADLRPVCPNCHAMIHRQNPPFAVKEIRDRMRAPISADESRILDTFRQKGTRPQPEGGLFVRFGDFGDEVSLGGEDEQARKALTSLVDGGYVDEANNGLYLTERGESLLSNTEEDPQ